MQEPWQSAFIDVFRQRGFDVVESPSSSKDCLRLNVASRLGRLVMRIDLEPTADEPPPTPRSVQWDQLFVKRTRSGHFTPRARTHGRLE